MAHGNVHIIKSRDQWESKLTEARSTQRVVLILFPSLLLLVVVVIIIVIEQ
jgi:hypothetical protein